MKRIVKSVTGIILSMLLPGSMINIHAAETAAVSIPMDELAKPQVIRLDDQNIYIVEGTSIYIYGLADHKLEKKFGKHGEGPQEFMINPLSAQPLSIHALGKEIVVSSLGKVSLFSKNGEYRKELKLHSGSGENIQPLGNGFAGMTIFPENDRLMRAVVLYGPDLKPVKTVKKVLHHFQGGKGFQVAREPIDFRTMDGHLIVTWDKDFNISVFNEQGVESRVIRFPYQRVKCTGFHKKEVINILKTDPRFKRHFQKLKPIRFPDYFPAIRELRTADGKIYAVTFKEENKHTEVVVMDLKGNLPEYKMVKMEKVNPLEFYPFTFKNDSLYQLVENNDTWTLNIKKL
ncbi:MAG: hypothetical protein GY940_38765 [bacterium]|nr:hypothetical protein [bacterium]